MYVITFTDENSVSVVIACDASEFGCCPDGVTAALGHQHAGCPSKCCSRALAKSHRKKFTYLFIYFLFVYLFGTTL